MSETGRPQGSSDRSPGPEELLMLLHEHDTRERAFEAYPDAVLVLDEDGTIVEMNRAAVELLGRTRDEHVRFDDVVVSSPVGDEPAEQLHGRVDVRHADGTTTSVSARSAVVPGETEALRLVVLSTRPPDPVTEALEAAEAEQRRLEQREREAWEARRSLEERVARLQAITDAALVHLELDQLLDELLGRLREVVGADAATILLLDHSEGVLRIRATSGLERELEDRLEVPLGVGVAGRIASEARPVIVADLGRVRAVSGFLGGRLRSLVGVPILLHGTVWGVLHVGSVRPRRFTDDDVALLELVASRLAPAIENAQLHEAERAARVAAERDAARVQLVQSIAEGLGRVAPVDEMAAAIVERVVPALGGVAGAVALLDRDPTTLRVAATVGYDEATIERWRAFPLHADVPAAAAAREARLFLVGSEAERDRRFPSLAGAAAAGRAWAALPLAVGARRLGAIAISFPQPRSFDEQDSALMIALAHQCSQALDRALLYEQERRSRARAESTSRRLALLQSLTARFSHALTAREIAAIVVEEAASALGATAGAVMLLDDAGMLELHAARGYDDEALAAWRRFPADLPTPAGDAIRQRDLVVVPGPAELVERYPLLGDAPSERVTGPTVALPILVDELAIGALAFSFPQARDVGADERPLLQAIGRHCGQALERARLYETERRARRDAERARDRVERLQALGASLGDAGTRDQVFSILTEHLVGAVGGVASLVHRIGRDGGIELAAARGYPAQDVAAWSPIGADDASPIAEAVRTRAAVWLSSGEELAERFPALADAQRRLGFRGAFASVPLKIGTRLLGAVAVQLAEPRTWSEEDKEFIRAIVRQAAQALGQTELHEAEAEAAHELERRERRYRSLVQASSAIVWTIDPAGAFVEPQPSWEAYTGQPWERHRGFGWLDAIHEDDREDVMRRWLAARDVGEFYEASGRLYHAESGTYRHFVTRGAPVRDQQGRIVEWVGAVTDDHEQREAELAATQREMEAREELEAAGERLAYLAAASNVLAGSLDVDTTLQRLADLAVPRLADWCAIEMVGEDGDVRLVALAHVDPAKIALARELRDAYPPDPNATTGVPWVLRTGRSLLMERIPPELLEQAKARGPELAALIDRLRLRSLMVVPISVGERVLGAMQFIWAESAMLYDRDDLALAEDLAHRAAVAIENARLFQAERAARRKEVRARERVQVLAEAGAAMAETLDVRRMLTSLVRTASRRLADLSSAYTIDPTGRVIDVVTAHSDPTLDPILQRAASIRLPDADDRGGLAAAVLRTNEPVFEPTLGPTFADDISTTAEQRELVRRLRLTSGIAVPLSAHGRLLAILTLFRSEASPPFDRDDLDLVVELGHRAGSLLENARLYTERHTIADTLQRSLLPPDLPVVPGLEVGARYRPAAPGTAVGGDFYDVFEIDLEHWGVVIGDVVGKGAEAAAMMALARYTVRTAALTENRPSSLLSTLNDAVVRQMPESMFCTACFARVRRSGDTVRATIASGGHPLPFLVRADGGVHEVGEPGTLLGVFDDPSLTDVVVDLAHGDALVLYTDGVTDERRGEEEFGEERLRDLLATVAGESAERIAGAVDRAVAEFGTDGPRDDLAVLVIRVTS